jgi:fatty acid desaturase
MGALGVIQLVTPPTVLDADVLLRFATAALALVLVALTNVLSPIVVLWIVVVALVAQVVVELLSHEEHHHETAVSV